MSSEIPSPPGIPILGNVFDVDPNNTWTSLNKLAAQYGKCASPPKQHPVSELMIVSRPHFQD
jgi:hypothetical protein